MTTYILITLLGISAFLAIKWKLEKDVAEDMCADCMKRLDESAQNNFKSEYVQQLQKQLEHYENYFKNHHSTDL